MFKPGDMVRVIGEKETGEIVAIIDGTALVQYKTGKRKIALSALIAQHETSVTAAQFDEAVKSLMYQIADDVGHTAQLDQVLEIAAVVCKRLKTRLFEDE